MAIVKAMKSGYWHDTTVWDTGAVPTSADHVFANNYNIYIQTNAEAASIRTMVYGGITAGGTFVIPSGVPPVTLTFGDMFAGPTVCLNALNRPSSGFNVIYGNAWGGSASGAHGAQLHRMAVLYGNSTAGSVANAHGVQIYSGKQYGNSTGGSAPINTYGTHLVSGSVQIGNSTGGSIGATGSYIANGSTQYGNSIGGDANGAYGTDIVYGSIQIGASVGGTNTGAYGTNVDGSVLISTRSLVAGTAAAVQFSGFGYHYYHEGIDTTSISNSGGHYVVNNPTIGPIPLPINWDALEQLINT